MTFYLTVRNIRALLHNGPHLSLPDLQKSIHADFLCTHVSMFTNYNHLQIAKHTHYTGDLPLTMPPKTS